MAGNVKSILQLINTTSDPASMKRKAHSFESQHSISEEPEEREEKAEKK